MKTRWDFFFEAKGLKFERKHAYEVRASEEQLRTMKLPLGGDPVRFTIEPDDEPYNPELTQTGKVTITLPLDVEEAKSYAYSLSSVLAQQVAFNHRGEFKVVYGLVTGERLPENDDEARAVGDTPYFGEARLVEVDDSVEVFDGASMTTLKGNPLLQQFNVAVRDENPIDRYLGLFKILEGVYAPRGIPPSLAAQMKASNVLFEIAKRRVTAVSGPATDAEKKAEFDTLVARMVDARNQCAHLRTEADFGFTHGSQRAARALEPLVQIVTVLAQESIR